MQLLTIRWYLRRHHGRTMVVLQHLVMRGSQIARRRHLVLRGALSVACRSSSWSEQITMSQSSEGWWKGWMKRRKHRSLIERSWSIRNEWAAVASAVIQQVMKGNRIAGSFHQARSIGVRVIDASLLLLGHERKLSRFWWIHMDCALRCAWLDMASKNNLLSHSL